MLAHCLRVADLAADLASRWGADTQAAALAGVLHDYSREMSPAAVLERCRELGVSVGELEQARPVQLLHAPLAAAEARLLGLPPEVCQAIARHTIGGAGMTVLDQCVYVADGVEPGRRHARAAQLRRLSYESLGRAVAQSAQDTLAHLVGRGLPVHPQTLALYNECSLRGLL